MTPRPSAYIAGIYEHPERSIETASLATVYVDIVAGVLADAGLTIDQVDGFHTSLTPGSMVSLADTLGLRNAKHFDGTDLGGATYVSSIATAARAIQAGDASIVLVVMAGLPRRGMFNRAAPGPHAVYEQAHGSTLVAQYALAAQRHMALYGTTSILWLAAIYLAVGGWADLVSAVYRSTILQVNATDEMRGRMQGVFTVVVAGARDPRSGVPERAPIVHRTRPLAQGLG